jgi:hypothetical protein
MPEEDTAFPQDHPRLPPTLRITNSSSNRRKAIQVHQCWAVVNPAYQAGPARMAMEHHTLPLEHRLMRPVPQVTEVMEGSIIKEVSLSDTLRESLQNQCGYTLPKQKLLRPTVNGLSPFLALRGLKLSWTCALQVTLLALHLPFQNIHKYLRPHLGTVLYRTVSLLPHLPSTRITNIATVITQSSSHGRHL